MIGRSPRLHWPLACQFVLVLLVGLVVLITLLQFGILTYAYGRLGLDQGAVLIILVLTIAGSAVNIPMARLPSRRPISGGGVVSVFGVRYVVPPLWVHEQTVIAVNVGGAVIPVTLSCYLVIHDRLGLGTLVAVLVVPLFVRLLARPVEGVGVVMPGLLPPVLAALTAIVLGGPAVPATAYVAGVLGCLIGADLLNLGRISQLGAPMGSIGGPAPLTASF